MLGLLVVWGGTPFGAVIGGVLAEQWSVMGVSLCLAGALVPALAVAAFLGRGSSQLGGMGPPADPGAAC